MKLRTHFLVADLASRRCGITGIRRAIFCIGSLIPDLTLTQLTHPHFYCHSGKYVARHISRFADHSSLTAYLELGKMAHYATDFCCSVHQGRNIGSIREHLLYERRLNSFAVRNFHSLLKKSMRMPLCTLDEALDIFRCGLKYDHETDLLCAVRACTAICAMTRFPERKSRRFFRRVKIKNKSAGCI